MPLDCELMFECNNHSCRPFDLNDCGSGYELFSCPYPDSDPFASFHTPPSYQNMSLSLPLRPILMVRSPPDSPTEDEEPLSPEPTTPTKTKKKVLFADEKGLMLTQIRIMTEPSDCPPKLSLELLDQVTKGASASVSPDLWEPQFQQPASDYVLFRQKLESIYISLENVIVKEAEESVLGTVKVKNIAFDKQVMVRVTFDDWVTKQDIAATFVPSGTEGTAVYDLYDTFSFTLAIPPGVAGQNRHLEFCVCFTCDGKEYWDNNNGANYKLVSKVEETKKIQKKLSSNEVLQASEEQTLEPTSTEAMLIQMIRYIERMYGIRHHPDET